MGTRLVHIFQALQHDWLHVIGAPSPLHALRQLAPVLQQMQHPCHPCKPMHLQQSANKTSMDAHSCGATLVPEEHWKFMCALYCQRATSVADVLLSCSDHQNVRLPMSVWCIAKKQLPYTWTIRTNRLTVLQQNQKCRIATVAVYSITASVQYFVTLSLSLAQELQQPALGCSVRKRKYLSQWQPP